MNTYTSYVLAIAYKKISNWLMEKAVCGYLYLKSYL